jgi:hypothetical protein
MFIDELTPVFRELARQPVSFLGGFFSGLLRLNLSDDPVKSWLDQQAGSPSSTVDTQLNDGKSGGPQSINIE